MLPIPQPVNSYPCPRWCDKHDLHRWEGDIDGWWREHTATFGVGRCRAVVAQWEELRDDQSSLIGQPAVIRLPALDHGPNGFINGPEISPGEVDTLLANITEARELIERASIEARSVGTVSVSS